MNVRRQRKCNFSRIDYHIYNLTFWKMKKKICKMKKKNWEMKKNPASQHRFCWAKWRKRFSKWRKKFSKWRKIFLNCSYLFLNYTKKPINWKKQYVRLFFSFSMLKIILAIQKFQKGSLGPFEMTSETSHFKGPKCPFLNPEQQEQIWVLNKGKNKRTYCFFQFMGFFCVI